MKNSLKRKLYEFHDSSLRPKPFAKWARPKASELNVKRTRYLGEDNEVVWDIKKDGCGVSDHIEMAGFYSSSIISYGNDSKGRLRVMKHLTIPTLRFQPNLTGSSFSHNFKEDTFLIDVNGKTITAEYPKTISIKGNLKIISDADCETQIVREFLPAVNQKALIESIQIVNQSDKSQKYQISADKYNKTVYEFWCVDGKITAGCSVLFDDVFRLSESCSCEFVLKPKESFHFYCVYYAYQEQMSSFSVQKEISARRAFIDEMFSSLKLKTSYPELDAQFSHCILRGSESIFKTRNGLMHSPGGGNYYAALWTNDQCEYANPFFPFSGYAIGIEQSINCYQLYEKYMDKSDKPMKEKKAIVTSIISEGIDYWNGAGDRGDCEMYAYGLSRFLLEMSDVKLVERFFDSLVWCLDFALSRKTPQGVIASDSDELENRFESGNANLFTSCITYDALGNCAVLADIIGDEAHKKIWIDEQKCLGIAIEQYFGASVEGFDTYRYYDGNTDLRSWICMPLTVEIFDRADQTTAALFSSRLYQNGMMKSTSANDTTWDRSLLFALRGVLLAGKSDVGIRETVNYCKNRLLGSHCPYPFEAYPEGNRAHLAAESILFARIITEGLFGLKAVGLNKLRIHPQTNAQCPEISLENIKLFSKCFDISADKTGISITYNNHTYCTDSKYAVFDFEKCIFD